MSNSTYGLVYSRLRTDEKMLIDAAKQRGVTLDPLYDEDIVFDIDRAPWDHAAILERSLSFYRSLYTLKFLDRHGIPAVNRHDVAQTCGDKAETSLRLARAGVPTPPTRVAFTRESALRALDEIGYPAVLKPTMGSWARLLAKVESPEHAEYILEHKEALGNPLQQIYYVQAYVDTARNGDGMHRDIRAFYVGDRVVAAIYRNSPHWITNTARGGRADNCPVTDDLNDVCSRAADAVGGGVLAMDVLEGPDGFLVHEVNHTMEFKNSVTPTGVDIPGHVIDYLVEQGRQ